MYKAERPGVPCRVYFLVYDNSLEEQRYMASLRRERQAFEQLIAARAHSAPPREQCGRHLAGVAAAGGTHRLLHGSDPRRAPPALPAGGGFDRGAGAALASSSRKGGGRLLLEAPLKPLQVVCDVREFMSPLPAVLHSRGMRLLPVTLEVGDFVLSPDMCVERKALPDLVSSFASGRLFNQATALCKHYACPILLIEFDAEKHFGLHAPGEAVPDHVSSNSLLGKLCLFLLQFPKFRILWSRSPHATADLFASLKQNADEPDPAAAAAVGVPDGGAAEEVLNQAALDFIQRLPGVTPRNFRGLLRGISRVSDLATLSEEELARLLGDARQGKTLHEFLHAPFPRTA